MTLRHGQAVLLMVLTTAMWSIAGVVSRQLQQAQSFEVTFWRSFFTVLSLVVILPLWQGRGVWRRCFPTQLLLRFRRIQQPKVSLKIFLHRSAVTERVAVRSKRFCRVLPYGWTVESFSK